MDVLFSLSKTSMYTFIRGYILFILFNRFELIDVDTVEYNELCNPNGSDKAEMQRENVAMFLSLRLRDAKQEGVIIGNTRIYVVLACCINNTLIAGRFILELQIQLREIATSNDVLRHCHQAKWET